MTDPPNPELSLLVEAAYEGMVREQLLAAEKWNRMFPVTEGMRARWAAEWEVEQDRRLSLMKDHMQEAGTMPVCRCGHNGYSTSGYLLHLYEVIATDALGDT